MKPDEALGRAMQSALRVDGPASSALTSTETELLLNLLESTPLNSFRAVTFAPMVQALVNSGSAFDVASRLFDQLTGPQIRSQKLGAISMAQRSLDVCLYESFRYGDSLILDRAEGNLAALETDLRSFEHRTGAGHSSFASAENHDTLSLRHRIRIGCRPDRFVALPKSFAR